jgi:hypothetical protein
MGRIEETDLRNGRVCRPYGTRVFPSRLPGTHVPGYLIPPLRGWIRVARGCFASR